MVSFRETPQPRLILLGASNLTLSLRLVIDLMQQQIGGPSEVLAAVGHGRAYGIFSQVVWRGLPGIADCGLWRQLSAMEPRLTYALLTDIGNDIVYELPVEQVLRSVERCVEQLQRQSAQIVVTNLPLASIERLSERRYTFFRNLFYPSCRLPRNETLSRARAVHAGLMDMAARRQFLLVEQEAHWFGTDGIHVNYWQREAFYRDIVRRFPDSGVKPEHRDDKRKRFLTWQRRPVFAFKTVLGRAIHCPQPSGQLADGSPVSKY
ncbi:hypothetical protein R2103_10985 [Nitrosomonas sp. Is24]|uniref:hypothetical protein n=1 Tax=Nitrosomonas sp. Is24 TaxID=3080533 RepID=UPI00294B12E4|nr:hypothetical protein [Nitrosomonas sp. Is24]MDV6342288.1 hypothetical protein [Nitrosomonas sp. Is24]